MPSLRELQHALRESLLRPEEGAAACVLAEGIAPRRRLDVYRNTFVSTLTKALRLDFPAVDRLVGAAFFDGAAYAFIHERPPRGACLDDYGDEFPAFVARFPPAASLTYLADVARLEWAVNLALHAPDVEPLAIERLAEVAPQDEPRVRFTPHPSVRFVAATHPVDAIWRAVLARDDRALTAIDPDAGQVSLLVARSESGVEVVRLDEPAWRFAAALCAGTPLGAALDLAEGIDAPALLAAHLAAGRFVGFELADPMAAAIKGWH